jgi:hypothetical protein
LMFKGVFLSVGPLWVYFTLVHSFPSITLPYPFTSQPPFFNSFQDTFLYPLPSHLMLCNKAQSFSFPFPLSPSSTKKFHCYKHVLHLSLYMIKLVFVYMFIFGSIFYIWEKICIFCVSDPLAISFLMRYVKSAHV